MSKQFNTQKKIKRHKLSWKAFVTVSTIFKNKNVLIILKIKHMFSASFQCVETRFKKKLGVELTNAGCSVSLENTKQNCNMN